MSSIPTDRGLGQVAAFELTEVQRLGRRGATCQERRRSQLEQLTSRGRRPIPEALADTVTQVVEVHITDETIQHHNHRVIRFRNRERTHSASLPTQPHTVKQHLRRAHIPGTMRSLDERIDLDEAVQQIASRTPGWRAAGMTVGEPTWRDENEPWPPSMKVDRAEVRSPDSVGVRCTKGVQEGSLVLFKGGWADLEFWAGAHTDVVVEAPGWEDWLDLEGFGALLDRFGSMFQ